MSQSKDLGPLIAAEAGGSRNRAITSAINGVTARRWLGYGAVYVVLTAIAIVFMIPLLWMFATSLKSRSEIFAWPPSWIPEQPLWSNYAMAFEKYPLARFMMNTSVLVIFNIIGELLAVPLIAYGFARLNFPFKRVLFILMLSTMMIPGQIKLIPLYSIYSRLGLVNTYVPLVLPAFFGNPFFIFLMVQYIRTIPRDLDEAARIDGASEWQVFWHVILPLARPALGALAIFTFVRHWNDFLWPLIALTRPQNYTLTVGVANLQGEFATDYGVIFAGAALAALPMIVFFFLFQRQFLEGVRMGAVKG